MLFIRLNKQFNMDKVNIIHIIVSDNNSYHFDIKGQFLLEKVEKVIIGVIKDFSNATDGFLTEI